MKSFFYLILIVTSFCSIGKIFAQTGISKKVLFIGNSYTEVNNLPQLIADVATSAGDNLTFDSSTPGGAFLIDQLMVSGYTGVPKIMNGGWDYVVLQDQSLAYTGHIPSYIHAAYRLDTIIKHYNLCAHTMYYITWGREDGMTFGSYHAMDSVIESNYMFAADSLHFEATPVGAIWRYLRTHHPSIDLFAADGSHPSPAGSYAAACGFYSTLFRKDPTLITFNALVTPADASIIRAAAKRIVFDSLSKWNVGVYDSLMSSTCVTTAIHEPTAQSLFKIYPNPASTFLTVTDFSRDNIKKEIQLAIYNTNGQLVQEVRTTNQGKVSIAHLPPGMYYVRCKNAPVAIIKLIKR